jgi:hypothetical protein
MVRQVTLGVRALDSQTRNSDPGTHGPNHHRCLECVASQQGTLRAPVSPIACKGDTSRNFNYQPLDIDPGRKIKHRLAGNENDLACLSLSQRRKKRIDAVDLVVTHCYHAGVALPATDGTTGIGSRTVNGVTYLHPGRLKRGSHRAQKTNHKEQSHQLSSHPSLRSPLWPYFQPVKARILILNQPCVIS